MVRAEVLKQPRQRGEDGAAVVRARAGRLLVVDDVALAPQLPLRARQLRVLRGVHLDAGGVGGGSYGCRG